MPGLHGLPTGGEKGFVQSPSATALVNEFVVPISSCGLKIEMIEMIEMIETDAVVFRIKSYLQLFKES